MFTPQDEQWMRQAIELAKAAGEQGEVPVGALLVHRDQVIAQGFNQPIRTQDPSAHAEMVVLREGARQLSNYRLLDTTLYVTLEPCMMCAGALVHARVQRLVYGAFDSKAGAVVSQARLLDQSFLNHRIQHAGGLLSETCGLLLSQFFLKKRSKELICKEKDLSEMSFQE